MTLIKTQAQHQRELKHTKVINLYKQLREENKSAKPYRIMVTVGSMTDMTPYGVRKVLEKHKIKF